MRRASPAHGRAPAAWRTRTTRRNPCITAEVAITVAVAATTAANAGLVSLDLESNFAPVARGGKRFVLTGANKYNKRYAYEKLEDAIHSYKCRKGWQEHHGQRAIKHAEVGMELAEMLTDQITKEKQR